MKKTYYAIALLLVLAGAVILYSMRDKNDITNYPSGGTQVIAIGDSLVRGTGASSADKNFVSLLSAEIGRPIANLGVSGNTSADVLARIAQLDQFDPGIVILLVGGNDALRGMPQAETFRNIEKIIQEIQKRGAVVLLLGIRGGLLSDGYREQFEALAEKYKTAYVEDVMDGIFARNQYLSDSIHPNDLGYRMIADRVRPVLAGLLE